MSDRLALARLLAPRIKAATDPAAWLKEFRGLLVADLTEATGTAAAPTATGYTGTITDSLGRKYHYVNGKRVAQDEHDTHVQAGGRSAEHLHTAAIEPHEADLHAAQLPPTKLGQGEQDALIQKYQSLAFATARRFHKLYGGDLDNLEGEALLGLTKAARGFDPNRIDPKTGRPIQFGTYATHYTQGYVRNAQNRTHSVFTGSLTGKTDEQIDVADPHSKPQDSRLAGEEVVQAMGRLLDDRERKIVQDFILQSKPLPKIAEEMGVSAARVHQLKDRALKKIRDHFATASVSESLAPAEGGYTGTITDSMGRTYHYVDGKRVAARDHEDHVRRTNHAAAEIHHDRPVEPEEADLHAGHLHRAALEYRRLGTKAPAFKAWFGDWETDPANASKVVDRTTGEPKETHGVRKVFHGTARDFPAFDPAKIDTVGGAQAGRGFYFAEDRRVADTWANQAREEGAPGHVHESYLNVRNPFEFDAPTKLEDWDAALAYLEGLPEHDSSRFAERVTEVKTLVGKTRAGRAVTSGDLAFALRTDLKGSKSGKDLADVLAHLGYDGGCHLAGDEYGTPVSEEAVRKHGGETYGRVWVAFRPEQIKAVGNRGTFDPRSANMLESAEADRLLDLPDVRQEDTYSCGAMSAMAVGSYYGVGPSGKEEWKKELHTNEETSTRPSAIVRYLTELGLEAEPRQDLTVHDLEDAWREGKPVICCVQEYGVPSKQASYKYGHYVVVIGVGLGHVFVQDPSMDNALQEPGGSQGRGDPEQILQAPGRSLIPFAVWNRAWHDRDVDGNTYVHFGIIVGPGRRGRPPHDRDVGESLEDLRVPLPLLSRDVFGYAEPPAGTDVPNFAQCASCVNLCHGRCTIMSGGNLIDVRNGSCDYYVYGTPGTGVPPGAGRQARLSRQTLGYVRRQVRCENCQHAGDGCCGLYAAMNTQHPDLFALDTLIRPHACCNAQTPKTADVREAAEGDAHHGYTGVLTDSAGRKYHYINGHRVSSGQHANHVAAGGKSDSHTHYNPLHSPLEADRVAAGLGRARPAAAPASSPPKGFTGEHEGRHYVRGTQVHPEMYKRFVAASPKNVAESAEPHAYSSTQLNLEDGVPSRSQAAVVALGKVKEMSLRVPHADLAGDGREEEPHITVRYGLHGRDPEEVARLVRGFGPVTAWLGKTGVFPADDPDDRRGGKEYDVVKISVNGPRLHELNRLLASLEHTDHFPRYCPHVTLAYVKPGCGVTHAGWDDLDGVALTFDRLVFSDPDGNRMEVSLLGEPDAEPDGAPPPGWAKIGGDLRPVASLDVLEGKSGIFTDQLGHKYRLEDGRRVSLGVAHAAGTAVRMVARAARHAVGPGGPLADLVDPHAAAEAAKVGVEVLSGAAKMEHRAAEFVRRQVARLPAVVRTPVAGVFKLGYGTYLTAAKAVAAVAREKDLDEEQQSRLTALVATADAVVGMKVLPSLLVGSGVGAPAAFGASFVPVASLLYLAFSTATDPAATWRAARKAVGRNPSPETS